MSRAELWEPRPSWQKIDLLCAAHHKWQRVERAISEAKRLRRVVSQASWGWEADPRSGYFYIASQLLGVLFWFNEFEFADFFFPTLPAILWLRATWFGNRESVELVSSTFFSGLVMWGTRGSGARVLPGNSIPGEVKCSFGVVLRHFSRAGSCHSDFELFLNLKGYSEGGGAGFRACANPVGCR